MQDHNNNSYKYLITPYMSHKGTRMFLQAVSKSLGSQLVYHNEAICKTGVRDVLGIIIRLDFNDIKALWFSAKQRQVRNNVKAQHNKGVSFLYFIRSFKYIISLSCVVNRNKCLMLPTAEPYIEAFLIRLLAEKYNQKCFNYYSRNFVAIQKDPGNYLPSSRNFKVLKDVLDNIDKTSVNYLYKSGLTYNAGGVFTGCKNHSLDNRKNYDGALKKDIGSSYIIFMHDFYDAPGVFGQGVYSSLVDWFLETVYFLKKNKLNFLIKQHPNQLEQSRILSEKLILKLNVKNLEITNLDTTSILKKQPYAIVSNHGSILIEAAAYGIPTVSSGISIASLLGIVYTSKNKKEYKEMLLEPKYSIIESEIIKEFLTKINKYEFEYRFNLPIVYSRSQFFLDKKPLNDRDLRDICEKSNVYYRELISSFSSNDYKKLINTLKIE